MKDLKNIKYLVGNKLQSKKTTTPYHKKICDFLSDFSEDLNSSPECKNYPDIKTLAFWCRRKNIYNLREKFLSNDTRLGQGLIFHITPSNIPTNFAYSLIFGLITGNSNIVKVPSKEFKQIEIICKSINKTLKKHRSIREMISVVRYNDNDNFTKKISSMCNVRLIWGGDNSIKNVRKFQINQRSIDLAFADRYSFCVINSSSILKLSNYETNRLVEKFYNDTYLVDQNACSSPHLIVWIGNKTKKAQNKFWEHLKLYANKKYNLTEAGIMEKYTQLCDHALSLKNLKKYKKYDNLIYTVTLKNLDKNNHNLRGKWGFFYEYSTNDLNRIKNYINNKYQTLTYFGMDKDSLKKFVINNQLQGIDRIVPVGQALDISFFWDGYDLNRILSRVVDIK